jgi:hypothetical protein
MSVAAVPTPLALEPQAVESDESEEFEPLEVEGESRAASQYGAPIAESRSVI